jgi:hypothetical protein
MDELQSSIVKDLESIRALPKLPTDVIPLIDNLLNPLKRGNGSHIKLVALRSLVNNMKKELERDGYKIT